MSEEEIQKAFKEHELKNYATFGFDTPKQTLITYYVIASLEKKRLKITKIINDKKCEIKVITQRGWYISFYNIRECYNTDLKHIKRNIKIIDFEII